jgi:hypothetical protein
MNTDPAHGLPRYTVACAHCGRILFRDARRLGDLQLEMIESHVLICRPLAAVEHTADLLAHCRVIEASRMPERLAV